MADPILKWVGGKRQLVPELLKRLPQSGGLPGDLAFNNYYEPFVGGGALFFALRELEGPRKRWTINDANPHLVNVYRQVRDNVEEVIEALRSLDARREILREGFRPLYADIRSSFNRVQRSADEGPVVAAWFIAMNAWGFNGLCRYNKKGEFNVPCGKFKKTPVLADKAENLRAASKALQGVSIKGLDFALAVIDAQAGDLVYFDPPYVPASVTSNFTEYAQQPFGPTEQERLVRVAISLVQRGVHVVLSNSDTETPRHLYSNAKYFQLHEVRARRAVNCKAGKRGAVGELVIVGRSP